MKHSILVVLFIIVWSPLFAYKGEYDGIWIQGNWAKSSQSILEIVKPLFENKPVSTRLFSTAINDVKKNYRKDGFYQADVNITPKIYRKRKYIVVSIQEGVKGRVRRIQITGIDSKLSGKLINEWLKLQEISEGKKLISAIDTKLANKLLIGPSLIDKSVRAKASIHSGVEVDFIFIRSKLEDLKAFLLEYLRDLGYLKPVGLGPRITWDSSNKNANVFFRLAPGQIARVKSVKVVGTLDEKWKASIHSMNEGLLNLKQIEELRQRKEKKLLNSGYPEAKVAVEIIELDKGAVRVVYEVDSGLKVFIQDISIRGNERTNLKVILAEIPLKPNKPFSLKDFTETRLRLMKLDVFSSVSPKLNNIFSSSGISHVLEVDVTEKKRYHLELGLGASFEDGPRVKTTFRMRNLFGWAAFFDAHAQVNYPAIFYSLPFIYSEAVKESLLHRFDEEPEWVRPFLYAEGKLILSLSFPKIYPISDKLGSSLRTVIRREIRSSYTLNQFTVVSVTSIRLGPHVTFGPRIEGTYAYFYCTNKTDLNISRCSEGGLRGRARLDSGIVEEISFGGFSNLKLDSLFHDRMRLNLAFKANFSIGSASLRETESFFSKSDQNSVKHVKIDVKGEWKAKLSEKLTSLVTIRFGSIMKLDHDSYVPLFDRFFLGGRTSVRGFHQDEILPADQSPALFDERSLSEGGYYVFSMQSEFIFPLSNKLSIAVFIDIGELLRNITLASFENMAIGVGSGFRYKTNFGEVQVDLAMKLMDGKRFTFQSLGDLFGIYFSLNLD